MLSADILADGVRGLVPKPLGIAEKKERLLQICICECAEYSGETFKAGQAQAPGHLDFIWH